MGFDSGVLADESTTFRWDGTKHFIESWYKDSTAADWMKNSVVWYSQAITKKLGKKKLNDYLKSFGYGNADTTAGLDDAWLTPDKENPTSQRGSLRLSAYDQIEFLKKFWRGQLKVSSRALELSKKISRVGESNGFVLHGKTGTGYTEGLGASIGWFIAHVEGQGRELVAVTALTRPTNAEGFSGPTAREMTKAILAEHGLW